MTKMIKISDLPKFELSEYLKTDEDVAQYLTMVLEEKDDLELIHASLWQHQRTFDCRKPSANLKNFAKKY